MARIIKTYLIIAATAITAGWTAPLFAQEPVTIYYFYGAGCPYCKQADAFLATFRIQNSGVVVRHFETWNDAQNDALMEYVVPQFGGSANGVPRMVIGNRVISGFDERSTPSQVATAVQMAHALDNPNPAGEVIAQWQEMWREPVLYNDTDNESAGWSGLEKAIAAVGGVLVVAVGVTGWMVVRTKR